MCLEMLHFKIVYILLFVFENVGLQNMFHLFLELPSPGPRTRPPAPAPGPAPGPDPGRPGPRPDPRPARTLPHPNPKCLTLTHPNPKCLTLTQPNPKSLTLTHLVTLSTCFHIWFEMCGMSIHNSQQYGKTYEANIFKTIIVNKKMKIQNCN